jgi:hypothetical protein
MSDTTYAPIPYTAYGWRDTPYIRGLADQYKLTDAEFDKAMSISMTALMVCPTAGFFGLFKTTLEQSVADIRKMCAEERDDGEPTKTPGEVVHTSGNYTIRQKGERLYTTYHDGDDKVGHSTNFEGAVGLMEMHKQERHLMSRGETRHSRRP